jgi:hypothetical protein
MQLKRAIFLGSALVAALTAFILVTGWDLRRREQERRLVDGWTRGMSWWDHQQTETENERTRQRKLREFSDVAVTVFQSDLEYYGGLQRWREKIPILRAYWRRAPFDDEPENVRVTAAYHLGTLGPHARPAVPALLRKLGDDTSRVQMTAAFSLGQIGEASPRVLAGLEKAATNGSPEVMFSAELSLWLLTGDTNYFTRADALIGTTPSWAGICIGRIGEKARPFGPTLLRITKNTPWGNTRMQLVEAHWRATNDKQAVQEALRQIGELLEEPGSTNSMGWTDAEQALGHAAHRLDTEREFRAAMRPLFAKVLERKGSPADVMAKTYLRLHRELDQSEEK